MMIRSVEDNANIENNEVMDGKVIRNARLARQLLNVGGNDVRIIDLKADKMDPDHKRSVFVFENTDKFQEIFSKVLEDNRRDRDNSAAEENKALKDELDDLKKKFAELSKMTEALNTATAKE